MAFSDKDKDKNEGRGRKRISRFKNQFEGMGFKSSFHNLQHDFSGPVQAKLEISSPGDIHEQQADEIARKVVSGEDAGMEVSASANTVMTKGEGSGLHVDEEFEHKLSSSRGRGEQLDESTRSEMEGHMASDLGEVRIHTDSEASEMSESINAKAFTHGLDIYFKDGEFSPDTSEGKELLAHELVHTVQQATDKNIRRKATPPGHDPVQYGNLEDGIIYVIDGDGDQYKELSLVFKRDSSDGADECKLYVNSSTAFGEGGPFKLKIPGIDWTTFYLAQTEKTNGLRPTEIQLLDVNFYNSRQETPLDRKLFVHPPKSSAEQGKYKIDHNNSVFDVSFDEVHTPALNVMTVDNSRKSETGYPSIEFLAGFYKDRFRLIIEPNTELQETTPEPWHAYKLLVAGLNDRGGFAFSTIRQFYLKKTIDQVSFNVVDSGISHLTFDIDGEGMNDLTIYTSMTRTYASPDIPASEDRKIEFMLYGSSFGKNGTQLIFNKSYGKFAYRQSNTIDSFYEKTAVKVTKDLEGVTVPGSIEADLGILNAQLEAAYKEAEPLKAVDADSFLLWQSFSDKMFQLLNVVAKDPQPNNQHEDFITATASLASSFYNGFIKEVGSNGDNLYGGKFAKSGTNKYTWVKKTSTMAGGSSEPLDIVGQVQRKEWDKAKTSFFKLSAGYNLWIADRIKEKNPDKKDLASRIGETSAQVGKLAELYGDENVTNLTRVKAIYYSYQSMGGKGSLTGYPLPLYFYFDKKEREWVVIDLVHAENPFFVTKSMGDTYTPQPGEEPPIELFQDLDHKDHLPQGIIYFQLASGVNGSVRLTDPWTVADMLSAAGLGLAAVGFSILTFGTGTPLAIAWATGFFYASAIVSTASAVADIYDAMEHGQATTMRILLDVLDIATSLLQLKLSAVGSVVATKGISTLSGFQRGMYFTLKAGTAGLEGVQLAVLGYDAYAKIQEINEGPGKPEDKSRAIAVLLSQFLITGAFFVLDLKGSKAKEDFGTDNQNKKEIKLYEFTDPETGKRIRMAFANLDLDAAEEWFQKVVRSFRAADLSPEQIVSMTEEAMSHLKAADQFLKAGDIEKAIEELDAFRTKTSHLGITPEQFDQMEKHLAKENNAVDPVAFRKSAQQPVNKEPQANEVTFTDPRGKTNVAKPNYLASDDTPLYYGTDMPTLLKELGLPGIDPYNISEADFEMIRETLFQNGLPARGHNTNLNQHALKTGEPSAFRGTTEIIGTNDGSAGATAWAGDGGIVIQIEGNTPGWELRSILGDNHPTSGEQEISILARVEGYKIKGIYKVYETLNGLRRTPIIVNPYAK